MKPVYTAPVSDTTGESISYVFRALKALEMLADAEATPDEIAVSLNVHRRTAQRLLDTMLTAGYVRPSPLDTRRYELTPKILTIAGRLRDRLSLVDMGQPYVRRLRDVTTEFAHLDIPVEGQVVSLVQARSSHRIRAELHPGVPGPMHAAAVGKALLAYLPEQFEAACRRGLPAFTPHTITTPDALVRRLEQVRAQGYAIDDEEIELDQRCIAAPVWDDFSRQVVAALGISGPSQRINAQTIPRLARHVQEIALELSHALGYDGASAPNRYQEDI